MHDSFRSLRPYWRGLPIIIFFMIISVFLAKIYLNYTTAMYESTSKLKLADLDEGVPSNNLFKELDVFSSANKIAAEIEVLKSQVLIDKVVQELDFNVEIYRVGKIKSVELYDNSPFNVKFYNLKDEAYDKDFEIYLLNKKQFEFTLPTTKKKIKGELGDIVRTEIGTFFISLNDSICRANPNLKIEDRYKFSFYSPQRIYKNISKNLTITPVDKDVPVIRITYKNSNPKKVSRIVNKIAEAYIEDYIETKYKAAHLTVRFLEGQIDQTITKIAKSEDHIQTYRDTMRITNIVQETETDLRKVSELKIQQTNLKMSLEAIRELNKYLKEGKDHFLDLAPNFEAFTDLLSTEIIKKIKDLQSTKKDLLLVFTKNDERVKIIDAKIDDLKAYLLESINNTRKNLETKSLKLAREIATAESVFIGVPEKERVLSDLNREFNIYQQTYNFLNEKKIEAEIAAAAKIAFHKIISPGEIPQDPVSPNRTIITIVAAMLGMFSAIFLIFIIHSLKAKVNDVYTIESSSTIPVALLTPKLQNRNERAKHFLKEAIELDIKGLAKDNTILGFTSFEFMDGAYFNAFYLAQAFASQERKVLLLDVDNQFKYFKESEMKDAIVVDNLEIKTLSHSSFNRFTSTKMKDYFDELRKEYDLVIMLNESLITESKAKLLMTMVDVNLIVLDSRITPKKRVGELEIMKEEYKFPSMFYVLNRFDYTPSLLKEFALITNKKSKYFQYVLNFLKKIKLSNEKIT